MKIARHTIMLLQEACWSAVGAGMLVVLVAAMRVKQSKVCKAVLIEINGPETGEWFVEKKDVLNLLTATGTNKLQGEELGTFKLQQLEARLKKNIWIRHAQLYFDSRDRLCVQVKERVPVARIFTSTGASFYIDSSLKRLPVSDRTVLKLPVFTGFPTGRPVLKQTDTLLLRQIEQMSRVLHTDPFWKAQVAQVDITVKREFELSPTVGNHLILFGEGTDMDNKFRKLRLFYEQVAAKAGFDKYSVINIKYSGQVIGVKRENQVQESSALPTYNTLQNKNN